MKRKTKEQRIEEIMLNLRILKSDFQNFNDWDTKDDENWEAMVDLVEVIEQQLNNI